MRLISYLGFTAYATAMALEYPPSRVEEVERRDDTQPTLAPSEVPRLDQPTSQGCYSDLGDLSDPKGYEPFKVSVGFCLDTVCKGSLVVAIKDSACYCGDKYPPKDTLVEDKNCNYACPAYPLQACGGISGGKYYSVFNTGKQVQVAFSGDPTESDTPTTSSSSPETVTAEASSKANVGGIAGGVVVGVVAVAGIGFGVWFYMRRKRNQEIEDEHRRNAAIGGFMSHKPSSSGNVSITDSRLDPGMVQRRLSDGSIADNQDYSRKILRVTNA